MSKSNTYENDILLLELNNTNIANVGDATGLRGSTAAGNVELSLHTADPGEGGSQTSSECAYANYARVPVARSGAGWSVSGSQASLVAAQSFPQAGAGANEVATHWGYGTVHTGAGKLMRSGVIGSLLGAFTVDANGVTNDLITRPVHGLAAGDRVVFEAVEGTSLPTGLTQGVSYFVIATGLTTDAFKVSTTLGGSAVDLTVAGAGIAFKSTPLTILPNVTPQLTTGTVVVES